MRLALLLALLLVAPGPTPAEDDDGLEPLDPYGVDDPYGDGLDGFYEEDPGERDELLGLHDDDSADRMEGMADEMEREAEDAGEPQDPLMDDADEFGDPFADITKDPYEDDEPEEPATDIDGGTSAVDPLGPSDPDAAPAPLLGSPLEEDPSLDDAP